MRELCAASAGGVIEVIEGIVRLTTSRIACAFLALALVSARAPHGARGAPPEIDGSLDASAAPHRQSAGPITSPPRGPPAGNLAPSRRDAPTTLLRVVPPSRGRVRVDTFWSQALGIRKQYVVYLPPSYDVDSARRYPVAYYLHGLWGAEWDWVRQGRLDAAMDSLLSSGAAAGSRSGAAAGARGARAELIVVMPDGDDGWYTTWNNLGTWAECRRKPAREGESAASYCVPWPHYDEYIARDLVAHVDSAYRTLPDRAHRGIAGLSMGGYGAVTLALRYPDVFAAAASHSGVLAPMYVGAHPFTPPPRYMTSMDDVRSRWRPFWWSMGLAFGTDTAAWYSREPVRLARRLLAAGYAPAARARRTGGGARTFPALFFDAGRGDSLVIDDNRAFDAELTALGVPHRYAEWPGRHDWVYWRAHVGQSLAWLMGVLTAPTAG